MSSLIIDLVVIFDESVVSTCFEVEMKRRYAHVGGRWRGVVSHGITPTVHIEPKTRVRVK